MSPRIVVPDSVKRATQSECESGIVFDWNFHIACNYRCPYCYYDGHWESLGKLNRRLPVEKLLAKWEQVYESYGECYVLFNGGEPTVYPDFLPLMAGLSRRHRWNFNTNLWWDIPRWRTFAEAVDVTKGNVQFSFHPTEVDGFEPYLERAAFAKDLGFRNLSVCIVVYPPFVPELRRYVRGFMDLGLVVRVQPFAGKHEGRDYPFSYAPEERALIRELSGEAQSSLEGSQLDYAIGEFNPRGKPCRAGQFYCHINQQGDLYRCTQIGQVAGNKMGNFYDDSELRLDEQPRPCPLEFCRCGESKWLVENCG